MLCFPIASHSYEQRERILFGLRLLGNYSRGNAASIGNIVKFARKNQWFYKERLKNIELF